MRGGVDIDAALIVPVNREGASHGLGDIPHLCRRLLINSFSSGDTLRDP